ncbi:MAG: hypothetical protein A3A86_02865 [Elusimicrobia bacterium RIFCSPLOWO2_01_FULL_60_11]|nr:MAG: hypothetical protein A3A86_02865 [Elusimicrobia bacterium RIFCSPLOWO2_01_FULL_60_11]
MGDDQILTRRPAGFADLVRQGLERSSLSLRELCRRSGTDASFMSKVIRGILPPPADERLLKRMAKALDVDALTLIISTGRIPAEMRRDPESTKRLLEREETKKPVHIMRSPQLSEDLL